MTVATERRRLGARGRRRLQHHPSQTVVAAFAAVIAVGTVLLMLPVSRAGAGSAPIVDALFTATSAVCVTGLIVVDTPTYWSGFGEAVILALIQVGGFGIMALASLLGVVVARRLGLRSKLTAATETKSLGIGEVRALVLGVLRVTVLCEALTAIVLSARFALEYDETVGRALELGVFHAVSAFNNAGFALFSDSLMGFANDPWICVPIGLAAIVGGLGFPVLLELRRHYRRPRRWSLHTKLTLTMTTILLVLGCVFITASEWSNPATMGALDTRGRLLTGWFHAVMPRTAGFNSLDVAQMHDGTLFGTTILMFIGGGSAGTAGGIKVTTFVVLFFVILAEVRGEESAQAFHRRIDARVQRQALTVALLAVGAIAGATLVLTASTAHTLTELLFEVTSAFGTVGLSTGITGDLPVLGELVLVTLMFVGRLGPITLVTALAVRERRVLYQHPVERPIIG